MARHGTAALLGLALDPPAELPQPAAMTAIASATTSAARAANPLALWRAVAPAFCGADDFMST